MRRSDVVCVLGVIGAALVLHGPAIVRGRVLLPADVVLLMRPWGLNARSRFPEFRFTQNQMLGPIFEYYSWRHYARERMRAGELPLWNPRELAGNVLLANSQSAVLYPPNLLLYLLPLWVGVNLVTLFHSIATGLLMYGLLRTVRLAPVSALTGALTWMLCGCMLVWTEFQTPTAALCWLPGALWAWEWAAVRRRPLAGGAGVAVALGLTLTAGHPQFALYVVTASAVFMLWRTPRIALIAVPATLVVALALAGATILPVAEATAINHRSNSRSYMQSVALRLPPAYLGGLLLPNALGNPRDYMQIVDGEPRPGNPYIGRYDFIEYTHYVGIPALVLALVGLVGQFRAPHVRYLALLGLLGLALALGTWVGAAFFYLVPGYGQFHAPARAVCLLSFALAGLAAFGVESVMAPANEGGAQRVMKVGVRLSACVGLCAVLVWPLAALAEPILWTTTWVSYEAAGIRAAVLAAAATGLMFWLALRQGTTRTTAALAQAGLPLLCAADLMLWGVSFNPSCEPEMLTDDTATSALLRAATPGRVLSLEEPALGVKGLIVPNYNAVVGFREVQGADSVHSRRYHVALSAVAETMSARRPAFPEANTVRLPGADHPLLDALNVTHVTTCPPTDLPSDRFMRESDAELTIWRNPRACGPCWLVRRAVRTPNAADAVGVMGRPGFDVRNEATIEGAPPALDRSAEGDARLRSFSPHRVVCEAVSTGSALLVVSEPAYPGWKATVRTGGGSRPAPILIADAVLRSVTVGPGLSVVEFRYEPASFLVGLYLTCLSIALMAGLGAWSMALRRGCTDGP